MNQAKRPEQMSPEELPDILPILPLYDVVLFQLIDEAMSQNRIIGTVASRSSEPKSEYAPDDLFGFGTSAVILKMAKVEEDKAQLLLQGIGRFKIKEYTQINPYFKAGLDHLTIAWEKDREIEAMMANLANQYQKVVQGGAFHHACRQGR